MQNEAHPRGNGTARTSAGPVARSERSEQLDAVMAAMEPLPLDPADKALVAKAVLLVRTAPAAFQGEADRLELEFSKKRGEEAKEPQWRRALEHRMHQLKDVIGPGEVRSRLTGECWTGATAWRDGPDGEPFYDRKLAAKIEAEARTVSPKQFDLIRRQRGEEIKEVEAELKAGPKADKVERLRAAIAHLATSNFPYGDGQHAFARKVIFVAALCVWHGAFPGMGELAEWRWNGRASLLEDPLFSEVEEEGRAPHSDPELGREQVLFPAMKEMPPDQTSFDPAFADRLEKAVRLLENQEPTGGRGGNDAARGQEHGPAKGRGGRRRLSGRATAQRNAILEAWDQAKAAGVAAKDFCPDHGITCATLRQYVDWRAKRRLGAAEK